MVRKYHNHKLQTNLWHRKEEPLAFFYLWWHRAIRLSVKHCSLWLLHASDDLFHRLSSKSDIVVEFDHEKCFFLLWMPNLGGHYHIIRIGVIISHELTFKKWLPFSNFFLGKLAFVYWGFFSPAPYTPLKHWYNAAIVAHTCCIFWCKSISAFALSTAVKAQVSLCNMQAH